MIENIFGYPFYIEQIDIPTGFDKTIQKELANLTFPATPEGWNCDVQTSKGTNGNHGKGKFSGPTWDKLHRLMQPHISAYMQPFLDSVIKECKPQIRIGYWINKYEKGQWQEEHTHAGWHVFLSGIMLLTDPDENSAVTSFHNPHKDAMQYMATLGVSTFNNPFFTQSILSESLLLHLDKYCILLFPATVPHSVTPHQSDTPRFSLSFNYEINLLPLES